MTQDFIVAIPARYGASRLPGKPLRLLAGEPLVLHVARRALAAGARVVGGHPGLARAGGQRAAGDVQDQRFARQQSQRLAGQAGRGMARGDGDDEVVRHGAQVTRSGMASLSNSAIHKASGSSASTGTT